MISGILGKKIGMTSIFGIDGMMIPVTVVQAGPCIVTQIKKIDTDQYDSVQLGFEEKPIYKLNKPLSGHLRKSSEKGLRILKEFRLKDIKEFNEGQIIDVSIFTIGDKINVSGISKGKGFQGAIKRHGFSRGPETHGGKSHRRTGSIGASAWPSRVAKGKKMPGHKGVEKVTVKNLQIVDIKPENNLLLIKGCIPGSKQGMLKLYKVRQ